MRNIQEIISILLLTVVCSNGFSTSYKTNDKYLQISSCSSQCYPLLNECKTTTTAIETSSSSSSSSIRQLQSKQQPKLQLLKSRTSSNSNSKLYMMTPTILQDGWDAYNSALVTDPLIVKSVTASIILGAADITGQVFENSKVSNKEENTNNNNNNNNNNINFLRAGRFALFGLILQAPWNHYYYMILDGQIPPTPDEPFSITNIIKVTIDQFIQAPIFTIIIFVFLGLLEGKALSTIQQQLDEDYKDTMIANWKLWVPATVINIAFVPPILRVLYLNIIFFFWSIYLSLIVNKDKSSST